MQRRATECTVMQPGVTGCDSAAPARRTNRPRGVGIRLWERGQSEVIVARAERTHCATQTRSGCNVVQRHAPGCNRALRGRAVGAERTHLPKWQERRAGDL